MSFKKSELRQSDHYKLVHDYLMQHPTAFWHQDMGPDPDEWWMAGIDVGLYDHCSSPELTAFELAAYELAGFDWAKGK